MSSDKRIERRSGGSGQRRSGATLVFMAITISALLAFVAVAIDIAFITTTRCQLQAASDSGSLAGGYELPFGLGVGAAVTEAEAETAARAKAVEYAAMHRAGERSSVYGDPTRDVRFGNAELLVDGTWQKTWNTAPFNMVGVTLRRDQKGSTNGDSPLPLFLGGFLGNWTADVGATSAAAFLPGSTFDIPPGSNLTSGVIPFAIDEESWDRVVNQQAPTVDNFSWDPETGDVTEGVDDGIYEGDLYPHDDETIPNPGNRGTVDFGGEDNSTQVIKRQITDGLNADDLSYYPDGELHASEDEPLISNGDTGLSAGFENALQSIIGEPRAVPVFRTISEGSGENVSYTIVKFVGIVILDVELGGSPETKHVYFQPAPFVDPTIVPDPGGEITPESIFTPLVLVE